MAQVKIEGVTKRFDDVVAVKNVDLHIKDQEFLVLVGPSGCGKTTLLRMIAGLEEISEGTVSIGDLVVNDVPPKDRNIAMVFQNYALYPHMKVYENMAFGLKLRGHSKKEIDRRVADAAEILDLSNLLKRLPKQLSGGQRQRVALGRAIVRHPQVFLMDEPLSNLDAKLRVQMRAELKKIHDRLKTTIVYVTHDQVEAMTLGERIAVILKGELQQVDSPLKIYEKPDNRFVAGFIGSPPMNFIKGGLAQEGDRLVFKCSSFKFPIPKDFEEFIREYVGKDVTLGIRPEDIIDAKNQDWLTEKMAVSTKVNFRELMGSETYLYLKAGSESLVSRVDAMCDTASGSAFNVVINLRKIHLFDCDTQKVIF
ncbi:MAG: sn-glycerol-3-phosphate ABC transporter ATP-binding protein UgpC [Candidatus Margulisbacteria bacterium]|nr:sn-glycerol-3-phosphate ABC transporter ATP-binding protein UgpC [Candidatus Margulisiibacteriota bacterium]MBU1021543.1 sn-glycerol-3-phosphate ABC transporter ATP-binding protein UgpC [Candidatus Margulisiibacteriota bacterium]MBU1728694.1 sn-glycerol-3-phosphate ABC transporter ATP-binding protein UgpC [Candidatus Margulisiibacteriota bacterium]MBU1955145.1 sn-glycerol-3-phosphate ABC transporter ATP-binding protein UgpC [Candidatus Margulisiibacteriota bacterium]